ATYYINEKLNFNYRTTSLIELTNRNLKNFIINGNNRIPQLSTPIPSPTPLPYPILSAILLPLHYTTY
ncbi:hypothetical protein QBC45DRAFT_327531, partial [Copromyces sp. CBS 386.78]